MANKLFLSYSGISCFMDCKRMYWLRYINNLERIKFMPHYIMGNAIQFGVALLYQKDPEFVKKTLKEFNRLRQKLRGEMALTGNQEQELNEQEFIIIGMLEAYKDIHKKHINILTHKHNELYEKVDIGNDIIIGIKIDNIISKKNKLFVHELKSAKTLTPDYIKNIQNDLQTAIYFNIYNKYKLGPKLNGIIYDVIQKPSIRQKQKESRHDFIIRLKDWYKGSDNTNKYYMETINEPLLTQDRIMTTIHGVAKDITCRTTIEDFYPNDRFCYVYRRCEYYDLCHEGSKPEIMANFRKRGGDKIDNKEKSKKTIKKV